MQVCYKPKFMQNDNRKGKFYMDFAAQWIPFIGMPRILLLIIQMKKKMNLLLVQYLKLIMTATFFCAVSIPEKEKEISRLYFFSFVCVTEKARGICIFC